MMGSKERPVAGCLIGTAVGDAMGLCFENLSKQRQRRMFPHITGYHFFFGKGMVSDDTEHACMVAQALIFSAGDPEKFVRKLSWNLRIWLLGCPPAVGSATLRAILKLWIGFSGRHSGVFSAGNGPGMRSPLIGVCHGHDKDKMRRLARCSTRMTHTDPKAEHGALAVALGACLASQQKEVSPRGYYQELQRLLAKDKAEEFLELIEQAVMSIGKNETTESFASSLGLGNGISGYMYHTIPLVVHCWLRHQNDFETGVREMIRCGGDTDTTAAMVGAMIGSRTGPDGIPQEWQHNLWEWPRTKIWLRTLGKQLAEVCDSGSPQSPVTVPLFGTILRNVAFLMILLFHVLRRLMPPY